MSSLSIDTCLLSLDTRGFAIDRPSESIDSETVASLSIDSCLFSLDRCPVSLDTPGFAIDSRPKAIDSETVASP